MSRLTFGGLIRRSTVGLVMVGLWLHLGANASLAGASPSLAASFRPVFPGQTSYVTSAIQASQTAATANDLTYRGGLVQQNPSVYVVFWHWQGQDPAGEEPYLEGFLQGMGGSAWLNTVTQYCQAIAVGSSVCDGAGQAAGNPKAIFKGTWHDDQNWVGGSPSYSDVQSEVALAAVHFGLSRDPALESNYQVLVAFPHGTAIPEQNICGMHETVAGGAFEGLPYVEMPYLPDMGQSCGRNFVNLGEAGLLDGVGIVAGHEIAETITDPYPPDGWYTDNGEIGDLCAWLRSGPGAVADVSLSTGTFAVQGLWSNSVANGSGGCTTSYLGNAPLSSPSAQVSPTPSPVSTSGPSKATTFYFTEGYTGPGFQEKLNLLMPLTSGVATVTYYTAGGQLQTAVPLVAGVPVAVDVNAAVGPWQNVSARVDFPAPGVAERRLTFASGLWKGTTDEVGVTSPSSHWDFAEGSTLGGFSEFLTILNPDPQPVVATLNYFTDQGAHPTKTVALPASSRTTVEVFRGSLADQANCDPLAGTCGVGRDISGVSARVTTPAGRPVVVERPVYLNNQDFGSGQISDGHDTFGAGSASQAWYFAEGTTLPGFNEFLTIENPGSVTAKVQITYQESGSVLARSLVVPPLSRSTVEVFKTPLGVGPGVPAVSAQVVSDQPVVVERPLYAVHDFGGGTVRGATDALGATSLGTVFGFANASTMSGDWDFLTFQNPGSVAASVKVSYYDTTAVIQQSLTVPAGSRQTLQLFTAGQGPGIGDPLVGTVITSDQPILVEKPDYSTNGTGGAADAMGYQPASGSFQP